MTHIPSKRQLHPFEGRLSLPCDVTYDSGAHQVVNDWWGIFTLPGDILVGNYDRYFWALYDAYDMPLRIDAEQKRQDEEWQRRLDRNAQPVNDIIKQLAKVKGEQDMKLTVKDGIKAGLGFYLVQLAISVVALLVIGIVIGVAAYIGG